MTKKMNYLTDVTNEYYRPRVFILWTTEWDYDAFDAVVSVLTNSDHRVLNRGDDGPLEMASLRDNLRHLVDATAIAVDDTWWTSASAHQVVQVASWLGINFIDYFGTRIPTASLKGTA